MLVDSWWEHEDRAEPVHRAVVVLDVEASTTRPDSVKRALRTSLYAILDEALERSGIGAGDRDEPVDRGDGALVLVHPTDRVPKTRLLRRLVPALEHLLAEHNRRHPPLAFRLRVAVHAGEVQYDRHGPFGTAVDLACRLLDSAELRAALRRSPASTALAVSGSLHEAIVRHGYAGIDRDSYRPGGEITLGERTYPSWIEEPADSARVRRLA